MEHKHWNRLELAMVNAPYFRPLGGRLYMALWLGIDLELSKALRCE